MLTTRSWRRRRTGGAMLTGALLLAAPVPAAPPEPAGKPSLTVYAAKGFADRAWQQGAFAKVAKVWAPTAPPAVGKKTVVICEILRDGKVLDATIGTASGSEGWDKAALEAVAKAAPFAALPPAWPGSSLEVHLHFEYAK
jgi:protein TonB